MRGVILDRASLDNGDLDFTSLETSLDDWSFFDLTNSDEVIDHLRGATVAVVNKAVINDRIMSEVPELDLICVAATGTNNIDLDAARRRGIAVTNVTGYATPSVVQHVFALILALRTRLPEYQRAVKAGRWQQSPFFCLLDYSITELDGQCMGIVGYGELGQGVARVAAAFGMEVIIAARPGDPDPPPGRLPLMDLLSRADVVSLHCPLADNTRNLVGPEQLATMKKSALLINTARGGIVDETALLRALEDEQIGGAGIDVLAVEPPVDVSCLLKADRPNLVVTPHIAWASVQSRQRLINEVARNIAAYQAGELRNRVV
ncbi:MAG: 2-hydroxyacid dehydrogenase [Gammaproteobacteria bacterium]|nr:2-hydroxyacid dehydrogenase [Gammaproteobacteria bacterium]